MASCESEATSPAKVILHHGTWSWLINKEFSLGIVRSPLELLGVANEKLA